MAFNKDILEEIKNRLVNEFSPKQIILFGSRAWGNPTKDSDFDLLVIVDESPLKPTRRAIKAHQCLKGLGIAKDVMVRTTEEVKRAKNIPSSMLKKIVESGQVIYE